MLGGTGVHNIQERPGSKLRESLIFPTARPPRNTCAIAALREAALGADLDWLCGRVLAHNVAMPALLRGLDVCCTVDREDDSVMCAEASASRRDATGLRPLTAFMDRWTISPATTSP